MEGRERERQRVGGRERERQRGVEVERETERVGGREGDSGWTGRGKRVMLEALFTAGSRDRHLTSRAPF